MREYLVCYDYGMGGLWWWIKAPNVEAITDRYEGVIVFSEPPAWWDEVHDRTVEHRQLNDPDTGSLVDLRRRSTGTSAEQE